MVHRLGSAGVLAVGGAILLLNKIAMGQFVGLGPLFVLCLILDYTKPLFQSWLGRPIEFLLRRCFPEERQMRVVMDEEVTRWAARRKSALVLEIIQGKTTVVSPAPPGFAQQGAWRETPASSSPASTVVPSSVSPPIPFSPPPTQQGPARSSGPQA